MKFSSVLDQEDDAEFDPGTVSSATIVTWRDNFSAEAGCEPPREERATNLQLIAMWFRVVQLAQSAASGAVNDEVLKDAWDHIGDHYRDRQQMDKAAQYYVQAKNWAQLANCYAKLESYEKLNAMVSELPAGDVDLLRQ